MKINSFTLAIFVAGFSFSTFAQSGNPDAKDTSPFKSF